MAEESAVVSRRELAPTYVSRLLRLTLKELRETLRDRRTIITLLLMPVLLYPLLTLAFQRFVLSSATNAHVEYLLGIESPEDEIILSYCFRWAEKARSESKRSQPLSTSPAAFSNLAEPLLKYEVTSFLEQEVRDYHIDVGLRIDRRSQTKFRPDEDIAVDIELVYQPGNKLGERARDYLEQLLNGASDELLKARLSRLKVTQRPTPLVVELVPLRDPAEIQNQTLSAIIPVVLILMTITGAVYPAIDLTAGERERGTLEMLVAAPVPRLGLLFAKYVAVLTVAFLTAAVNLVSMTVTLLVSGMGAFLFGERGLSLLAVAEVFCLLILFAAFFSAVLLTVTSFARSFKEAQAYLIPLMLVSLGPGLMGLLPGIKLSGLLQVAPLVNVVVLSRDLLQGQAHFLSAVFVVGSTGLYAAAALAIAARIFGTHAILYESQTAWADLFRRPEERQPAPEVASAMLCLALLFPICYVMKGIVAHVAGTNIELHLLISSLGTFAIFMIIPWWAVRAGNVSTALAFPLWPFRFLTLVGALVCGLSLWPFALELVLLMHQLGVATIDPSQIEAGKQLISRFQQAPLPVLLLAVAVLPGVCEEFCFRGYLYRALETRMRAWQTVVITGTIFGLFHLVAVDQLAVERLAPTLFLGLILGWIRWRSGSILPGMALHVCHNGLMMLVMKYESLLKGFGWESTTDNPQLLPWPWLAGALPVVACGLGLVYIAGRHRASTTEPESSSALQDGRPGSSVF